MKPFKCNYEDCLKTFASKHDLKVHVNSIHLNLRPFKCHQCHASFNQKVNLERHFKSFEKRKNIECHICNVILKRKHEKLQHDKIYHNQC